MCVNISELNVLDHLLLYRLYEYDQDEHPPAEPLSNTARVVSIMWLDDLPASLCHMPERTWLSHRQIKM